ncbi:NAD(P)/FAD-dependent oxidoreductase [Sphingomonas abietis]|uniref:FAD-dependent oxidoreductase n=1 Tax=Sphingomonas abietis TaxID=3012344 RepID=A0ABY7NS23_9SPHN|nr:FAD-dependent oxidoreductase [Sphingomonas abietis]WBO23251.1 FAD-dependent oxidoreductase [Sphingomonas abietis]
MNEKTIIIGGGVVGLASGVALARRGYPVTLIEATPGRQAASWGNAGHIAIEQIEPLASYAAIRSAPGRLFSRGGALALPPAQWRAWLPFAARMMAAARPRRFEAGKAALSALVGEAMPAWRRLAAHLPDSDLLREQGHFVLWGSDAAASKGRSSWSAADTGTARFRDIGEDERRTLAALLKTAPAGAIRFENSGQIADLGRLANALERAFLQAGGRIVHGHVRLKPVSGCAGVSIDGGATFLPDQVVLAAGIRSGALIAPVGHRAPIVAERGYHIRARHHDWPANLPPVVFEDRSMIVTRYGDCVQAASIVELGDPDAPADPAKWQRLERHVAELGLPMRGPFERWMGSRPTLPDYLPAIGRSARCDNLVYAFGHQHLGLTLAPVTGEIVGALVAGEAPLLDIGAFDIDRFA